MVVNSPAWRTKTPMGETEIDRLLREGIAAARAGQKERARQLLLQVIAVNEEVEAAWLWLSGVVEDPQEQQICLENVLALNPDNKAAQAGLRWLREQGLIGPVEPEPPPPPPAPVAIEPEPPPPPPTPAAAEPPWPRPPRPVRKPVLTVEIDPFGCPYCGGSVSSEGLRCDHCRRPVALRSRRRTGGALDPGWPAVAFVLLGAASWTEGYLVSQSAQMSRLPAWLTQTAVRFLIGPALFSANGLPGDLVQFANVVTLSDYILGGLCVAAALGLALRWRGVYFASFLLVGLLAISSGAGLLAQIIGWLPAILRLGLIALALRWLADSAPAFEWETREYNADLDPDLRTDLDYYNRGLRYQEMGMWAKAAAHWQVAARLGPGKVQYPIALAHAYVEMGYPAAALAEAEKALTQAPDDEELRAFRDSLAELEGAR